MKIDLPPDPTSAGLARDAVRRACEGVDVDVHSVMLCTSELVTNAVLHGEPPIELEIDVVGAGVRVAVRDSDTSTVMRRRPVSPDTLSGRGLEIVHALASAWGSERTSRGKVSWFRIEGSG